MSEDVARSGAATQQEAEEEETLARCEVCRNWMKPFNPTAEMHICRTCLKECLVGERDDPETEGNSMNEYEYDSETLRKQDDRHARRARELARDGCHGEAVREAGQIEHYPRSAHVIDEVSR